MKKTWHKKGQAGETLTWVVATIIIVLILVFSVLITINLKDRIYSDRIIFENRFDFFALKSLISYLLTENDSGKNIFNQINEKRDFNDFNAPLAMKIFKGLYGTGYSSVVLDIGGNKAELSTLSKFKEDFYNTPSSYVFSERIFLGKDLYLTLYFGNRK